MADFPHRCADCLDELPREAKRFLVPRYPPSDPDPDDEFPDDDVIGMLDFVDDDLLKVVCESCAGWYPEPERREATLEELQ